MFIDIHTHAFHPKIAYRAVDHLNHYYNVDCAGDGTIDHLLQREKKAGMDKCVVLCAATSPAQVIPANNYAISLQREHAEVIAFGTMHPDFANWEAELARMKAAGLRGIKLHPDFQGFWLNDPKLLPIFEAAQKDFIFQIHIGDRNDPEKSPTCPYKMAAIADAFPGLTLIAAHFGGYQMWDHALKVYGHHFRENLWFDTSSSTPFLTPEKLRPLLAVLPPERLLFGTDWPLYDPQDEQVRLQAMAGFSDSQMEAVMSNAEQLLGQCEGLLWPQEHTEQHRH